MELSVKCPFIHSSVQFPKSKYIGPESLQVKQLLLSVVADLLHVLQLSWHLSIVLWVVSLQK